MNRRTFIQAGAAAAILAATTSPSTVLAQVIGLPRLKCFSDALPKNAKLPLLPAHRERVRQYSRIWALDSGALVTVDRGSRTASIASPDGRVTSLSNVWDVAELADGTLLVSTQKQGLIRTNADWKRLETLIAHNDFSPITKVASTGNRWVAYEPSLRRVVTSDGRTWPTWDALGLHSLQDIIGLPDGKFVIADSVAASVIVTNGRTTQILASYQDRNRDPAAPMALIKGRDETLWVRTTTPAVLQVKGFA